MSSVESIDGDLALEQFKIDSKSKYKCTLEEKLGALLISKDTLSKVAKEKESRPSNDDQGELTLVVPLSDTIIRQKGRIETNILWWPWMVMTRSLA
jgi:hypothetical protein